MSTRADVELPPFCLWNGDLQQGDVQSLCNRQVAQKPKGFLLEGAAVRANILYQAQLQRMERA